MKESFQIIREKNLDNGAQQEEYIVHQEDFVSLCKMFRQKKSEYEKSKSQLENNNNLSPEDYATKLKNKGDHLRNDLLDYMSGKKRKHPLKKVENDQRANLIFHEFNHEEDSKKYLNIYILSADETIVDQLLGIELTERQKVNSRGKQSLNSNSNQSPQSSQSDSTKCSSATQQQPPKSSSNSTYSSKTMQTDTESDEEEEIDEEQNLQFIRLDKETLDQLFKNLNLKLISGEDRDQLTQQVYTILLSRIPSEDQFNKLVKLNPNSNLERYAVCNDQDEGAIIIDFENFAGKCTQIKIPAISQNNNFSGIMTVARLDNEGQELDVYDILRIDGGIIVDIFHADPPPTVQNSRIADIYNEFSRGPGKIHSFREGIRATSNDQVQSPIR